MTEKETLIKEAKELGIEKGIFNMSIETLKKHIADKKSNSNGGDSKTKKIVKYKNMLKGIFTMLGMIWKPGQALPVSKEIAASKKFKHAVKLGVLVKK